MVTVEVSAEYPEKKHRVVAVADKDSGQFYMVPGPEALFVQEFLHGTVDYKLYLAGKERAKHSKGGVSA